MKQQLPALDIDEQEGSTEPRMQMQGWVTVGELRLTTGEWSLLRTLVTTPTLQTASNAQLEHLRAGQHSSSVATDIEELMSKRLVMVQSSTKEGRTIRPTGAALDAVAADGTSLPL